MAVGQMTAKQQQLVSRCQASWEVQFSKSRALVFSTFTADWLQRRYLSLDEFYIILHCLRKGNVICQ